MTREEILAMEPGRELDAKVCESLFGGKVLCWESGWAPDGCWSIDPGREVREPHYVERCYCGGKPDIRQHYTADERRVIEETGHALMCFELVPHYSTSIADAWLVVEAMAASGWELELRYLANRTIAGFHRRGVCHRAKCDTAPEAICKAALIAL